MTAQAHCWVSHRMGNRLESGRNSHGSRSVTIAGAIPRELSAGGCCPDDLLMVRHQCLKYSTRRIVGGISAVSSIRIPNRNARIVSFIADPGNIVAPHSAIWMQTDEKNRLHAGRRPPAGIDSSRQIEPDYYYQKLGDYDQKQQCKCCSKTIQQFLAPLVCYSISVMQGCDQLHPGGRSGLSRADATHSRIIIMQPPYQPEGLFICLYFMDIFEAVGMLDQEKRRMMVQS
jgi:hypothetical protein